MELQMPKDAGDWRKIMAMKVSSEYDSEGSIVVNKRESTGEFKYPLLGLVTKYVSVLYDYEDKNALVTLSSDLGRFLQAKYLRDVKAEQGELKLLAKSGDSRYKAELALDTPTTSLPRLSFTFPHGEMKIEDAMNEDSSTGLSISGFVGGTVMNGLVVADYKEDSGSLKYKFKDTEMTLCPTISWPAQEFTVAFKRQFDKSNKLSYFYNFGNETWSTIYKHKAGENFKFKVGFDSDVGVTWASAWVGKEEAGAKSAPRKCKLQVMLQVPNHDIHSAALLFRVKKRWDL